MLIADQMFPSACQGKCEIHEIQASVVSERGCVPGEDEVALVADCAQRLGCRLDLIGSVQVVHIVLQGAIIVASCHSKGLVADVCLHWARVHCQVVEVAGNLQGGQLFPWANHSRRPTLFGYHRIPAHFLCSH